MSSWSSYGSQQALTESWRNYLKEATVYRDVLAEVTILIAQIIQALGLEIEPVKIVDEFEAMIKGQNFELVQEQGRRVFTGEGAPLAFKPEGHKSLMKFMGELKKPENKDYLDQLGVALADAGFTEESLEKHNIRLTRAGRGPGGAGRVKGTGQVSGRRTTIDTNKNGKPDPGEPEGIDDDGDGVVDKVVEPETGKTRPYDPAEFDEPTFKGRTGAPLVDLEDQRARFHWANQKHRDHQGFYKRIDPEAAAAFKKFVAYLVTPLAEKPKPMPGLVGRQTLDALTDMSSMQENYDLVVGAIGDMYTPEQLQQALADMKDEGAMRLILDTLEDEENARSFIAMLKGEKAEKAPKEEEEEEKTDLWTRLKTVFGSAMDIASIASFFGPVGQAIGGAATLASMINNLTFSEPKYGWAAVDLAALAVALLPGGTAAVKGTALGAKLVIAMKAATTAKKAATAARIARGVHTGAKVTKGAVGAYNIKKELEDGLGEEVAAAVTEMLTATAEDGAYYANTVLDEVIGNTARYPEVQKKLLIFREKMEELQTASAPMEPAMFPEHPPSRRRPSAGASDEDLWATLPSSLRKDLLRQADEKTEALLRESRIKRWQVLAGINKEII